MTPRLPAAVAAAVLACLVLAGCAGSPEAKSGPEAPPPVPGSITGVVVDEAIRPIAGALVEVLGPSAAEPGLSSLTDGEGRFTLLGVDPGVHIVRASHGLYATQQQTVEVRDGAEEGVQAKFQLVRVILEDPYAQIQAFDGFLVCSVGFSLYASEECGEGAGVPCEVPPPVGCQRYGGQGNNFAQWDFYLDGPFVKTLIVEMAWEPTSPTLEEFQLNIGNDWTCDPFCNGNPLNVTGGPSPIYSTVSFDGLQLTDRGGNDVDLTSETRFSTFVWPNWGSGDPEQLNVAVNQPYQVFAVAFYYLPAPAGWSFLAGDALPA